MATNGFLAPRPGAVQRLATRMNAIDPLFFVPFLSHNFSWTLKRDTDGFNHKVRCQWLALPGKKSWPPNNHKNLCQES
jgi:hypothetical protein